MTILDDITNNWYTTRADQFRPDVEREFFGYHKHPRMDEFWTFAKDKAHSDAFDGGVHNNNEMYALVYTYYGAIINELDSWEREAHMTCPRDPKKRCLSPGPTRAGGCCCIIPPGPTNFSVIYRNPGHWDISTAFGRAFRIRGEQPNVVIYDERTDDERPHPRDSVNFKSVEGALSWCATQLMDETK